MSYWVLFLLDISTWLLCVFMVWHAGRLKLLHPASLYLFFHFYTFTYRLFLLANGAPTLFSGWGTQYDPIKPAEIARAEFVALLTLVTMTATWVTIGRRKVKKRVVFTPIRQTRYQRFSPRLMWYVLRLTLPIGIFSLIFFRVPMLTGSEGPNMGTWGTSSYIGASTMWFGMSLLVLIYYYGFRPLLTLLMVAYLFITLFTMSYVRAATIIPAIFLIMVYVRQHYTIHISPRVILSMVLVFILFLAGKSFGPTLRSGDLTATRALLAEQLTEAGTGTHGDLTFMDQLAAALTHVDERGMFYYGSTYVGLLFMPIPKQLWPAKPGVADWQKKELSTDRRPTGPCGMIVTAPGEAYANFGYAGVIFYAWGLALLLELVFHWMTDSYYYSLTNFYAISVYSILIQVFRDGFASFFVFQFAFIMPLTMVTALHISRIIFRSLIPNASIAASRRAVFQSGMPANRS